MDAKTLWGAPQRTFTVTDLALVDGELYVAGLGNEEFASTLRRLAVSLRAGRRLPTTVEMYHTSHDKYETASPIESFVPITLAGKPSLVAGYGCSPIVTVARAELARQEARARKDGGGARWREPSVRHDSLHEPEGERVHPRREQQPHAHPTRPGRDRGGEGDDDVGEAGVGAGGRRLLAGGDRSACCSSTTTTRTTLSC